APEDAPTTSVTRERRCAPSSHQTSLVKKSVSLNNHSINSTNVNQKSTQVFFYSATVNTDGVKA
ncbi:MAG: hypothetical protein WAL35_04365, partial [Acidimicrobiales bacterium]